MAINRIFALFYLFTVSLPSAAGDELSSKFVFDTLSKRIDVLTVEMKRDFKKIENWIENIENNVCNKKTGSQLSETILSLQQAGDMNNIKRTSSVFSKKLKRQTKAFHSMLKTEKAILREKVDHFQKLFHELQTDITSGFALLNVSVGNSIEKIQQIVNGHTAYTNISLQDMSLKIQENMNEYESNLAEISLQIKSNTKDAENKLYEVGESITASSHSNISRMKCEFSSKLSSEISKVTSKIYEIHRKECFFSRSSNDYMSTRTTTRSGLECQRWDKQTPHKHDYMDAQFPDGSKSKAKNYCRDPGTDGFPWCYTMDPDKRWENCGVPTCDEPARNNNIHDCYIITDKDRESGRSDKEICESQNKAPVCDANVNVQPGCENCNGCCQTKDCFSINPQFYNGKWHRGISGRQCQRWDSQQPHKHSNAESKKFPRDDSVFDAHNYCRDPSRSGFLWCYTEDPNMRWEKCGIPDCYD